MDFVKQMFGDFVIVDNKIWFSSSVMNGIFCADVDGGYAKHVAVFPGDSPFQRRLYTGMYVYGDELIFIPHMAEKISVYNMSKKIFTQLEAPNSKRERRSRAYISMQWKNKILLFNGYIPELTILNTDDYSMHKISLPITKEIFMFACTKCIVNDCAFVVVNNMLITVQLDSDRLSIKEIASNDVQLVGIWSDGEQFWVIDRKSQLYVFQSGEEKMQKVLKLLKMPEDKSFFRFRDIILLDYEAFFFVQGVQNIIRLDLLTMNKMLIPVESYKKEGAYMYVHYDKKKNEMQILLRGEDRHRILDLNTNMWRTIYYKTPINEIKEMYQKYGELRAESVNETPQGKGLESIDLYLMIQKERSTDRVQNIFGKKIYQHIL